MSEKTDISHPGVVDSVANGVVHVRILAQSACRTCHAKSACGVADMEEKVVDIPAGHAGNYKKGDQVTITMKRSLGTKAVFLGYLLPFLVVMIALVTIITLTGKEGLAALVSIGVLVPYYFLLYKMKDRLSKQFSFYIED